MVLIAAVFVLLYTGALLGWLKPLSNVTMATRLEPLIFIIIGYYFGRLPAQQNEKYLQGEIDRQRNRAELFEQVRQEKKALEQKLKSVEIILIPLTGESSAPDTNHLNSEKEDSLKTRQEFIINAINILNS